MLQCAHNVEPTAGKKLRTLGALEEYFWLSENTFPHTTMILAEVEGATTAEAWREAFKKVRHRYAEHLRTHSRWHITHNPHQPVAIPVFGGTCLLHSSGCVSGPIDSRRLSISFNKLADRILPITALLGVRAGRDISSPPTQRTQQKIKLERSQ